MRVITFDIETKNFFGEVDSNEPTALDISVVGVHDSADDSYKAYFEQDFGRLWPVLESADALVTWNGDHFDIPILNKYYPGDLTKIKSLDLMREVRNVLGRRLKLDSVAEATLGINKSGQGLQAIEWWAKGELDKLVKYCLDDVKITRQLYDFATNNSHLKYRDLGNLKEIRLNTSLWSMPERAALTYTLPF